MFLFSLLKMGFLGSPGFQGFAADRCWWQGKGGGEGEKQGVCRLSAERESRRLCFEVGHRRFRFVERKPLIYIKNV